MKRMWSRFGASVGLCSIAAAALANDTVVYTYDALGRLTASSVSGGPNNGLQTSTGFDPAGNRSSYAVAGAPAAILSVADASLTEGGIAVVTVTRTGSLAGAITVSYATSNGSAAAPADYAATTGVLTFAPGEASKTISITTVDDSIYKGTRTFNVTLSNPSSGASLVRATGVVSIIDNEVVPRISISNVTVVEGGSAVLTVTQSGATNTAVSVNYSTANGSATAPEDYAAASGAVTFQPGETSKTISISTVDDSIYEGTEAFTVGLSGATGAAVIDNAVGTVTLTDNDAAPNFSISSASTNEGGNVVLSVTKTGGAAMPLSVSYGTSDQTAVSPADYGAASGTLTFLPSETSKSITISTVDDTIYEGNEAFRVYLSDATGGATISNPTGIGTIVDNDAMPSFSVSGVTVTEGQVANITVTKTGATGLNSTVSYATADGTAGTSRYQSASGMLTFLPYETSKNISVSTINNSVFGNTKSFYINLSSANGATIGSSSAIVNILDDDQPPSLSAMNPTPVNEGGVLQFSIILTGQPYYEDPITVNYAISSGTATSGVDFTPSSGTLTFTPPQSVATISVPTTQDSDYEPDETVYLTISSPSVGAIATAQAVGTIVNDDPMPSTGPVANPDNAGSHPRCDEFTVSPLANDTDPGGHYPLRLVSVASGTGYVATVSGNNVNFFAKTGGTYNILYTVANSINQQAQGVISYTVSPGPVCAQP